MRKIIILAASLLVLLVAIYFGWRNQLFELPAFLNSAPAPRETIAVANAATPTVAEETIQLPPAVVEIPETITDKGGQPASPPTISTDYSLLPDFTADALWLYKSYNFAKVLLWHASTGTLEQFNYPDPKHTLVYGDQPSLFATPSGLILQGGKYRFADNFYTDHARIVLLTRNNEVVVGRLNTAREKPHFVLLADGSLLVVGGITNKQRVQNSGQVTRTNTVEHVSYRDGKLVVESLPDLPGEIRRDVGFVQLADGNVLAAGGSTSQYTGSKPMTAETYILDIANKSWRNGPLLTEPRTAAATLLLPDGSVMVTGGWTPTQTWQEEASRTSDLLAPGSNTFTPGPLLPIGIASPIATSVEDGLKSRHLFLLGGITKASKSSHEVHEYDTGNREWRTVASGCTSVYPHSAERFSYLPFFTFSVANGHNLYLWCYMGYTNGWLFLTPRLHDATAEDPGRIVSNAGVALHREGVAFIPQQGNSPALFAGGYVDSAPTAAVDAISSGGQVTPLANLNVARGDAQLFRLQDGSFIISGGTHGRFGRRNENDIHSMEWLPAGEPIAQAHWRLLDFTLPGGTTVAQLKNGKLLSLEYSGAVNLLDFAPATTGSLQKSSTAMPPLTRARHHTEDSEPITISEVSDGRIVVAGGAVQQQRIALLQGDSLDPQAVDNYVYIGGDVEARTYEIYNPRTNTWSESAPSRLQSGRIAILDDGRVMKFGELYTPPSNPGETWTWQGVYLEASTPDGSAWQEWPAIPELPVKKTRLFVIEGELFISAYRSGTHSDEAPTIVQWYDASSKQWSTVWEATAGDPWRKHLGRFIVRQLTNGKRIVLPVAGY